MSNFPIQINPDFWRGKNVLVTGHTGFKGTWLSLWLYSMGAKVTGYALEPPTDPNLYTLCRMDEIITSYIADIRDLSALQAAIEESAPHIVFHLAAQPLVRASYLNPIETYEINTIGTAKLLEAVSRASAGGVQVQAVIHVSTDKCYAPIAEARGYVESDTLGGADPYSNSKACAELIVSSYRQAYMQAASQTGRQVQLASVRAGNVIGGGDWAADRLIPDTFRAIQQGEPVKLRYPQAIRPWQHVLEPLHGYLLVAQQLMQDSGKAQAWNFGPNEADTVSVEQVVREVCAKWGEGAAYMVDQADHPQEAHVLRLDCSKSRQLLGWAPRWNLDTAITKSIEWVKAHRHGEDGREICARQIRQYVKGEGNG